MKSRYAAGTVGQRSLGRVVWAHCVGRVVLWITKKYPSACLSVPGAARSPQILAVLSLACCSQDNRASDPSSPPSASVLRCLCCTQQTPNPEWAHPILSAACPSLDRTEHTRAPRLHRRLCPTQVPLASWYRLFHPTVPSRPRPLKAMAVNGYAVVLRPPPPSPPPSPRYSR